MEPETLYRLLGRLIETIPDFAPHGNLTSDQLQWLGRARALISEMNDASLILEFIPAANALHGAIRLDARQKMMHALYNALAIAELKAPPSAQGAFIPASNRFDAFASINKILQSATSDVLIVDPYLDETILTEFGGSIPAAVPLRLLSDQATVKPALIPAAKAWAGQHGANRPLTVRLAASKSLHDRLVILVPGIIDARNVV